jgi:hypothetical protein
MNNILIHDTLQTEQTSIQIFYFTTYYKQNRHQEKHFNSRHTTNRTDIKKKHFNSRHTTNRTDIKKNILIHDILQTEQTSRKTF